MYWENRSCICWFLPDFSKSPHCKCLCRPNCCNYSTHVVLRALLRGQDCFKAGAEDELVCADVRSDDLYGNEVGLNGLCISIIRHWESRIYPKWCQNSTSLQTGGHSEVLADQFPFRGLQISCVVHCQMSSISRQDETRLKTSLYFGHLLEPPYFRGDELVDPRRRYRCLAQNSSFSQCSFCPKAKCHLGVYCLARYLKLVF